MLPVKAYHPFKKIKFGGVTRFLRLTIFLNPGRVRRHRKIRLWVESVWYQGEDRQDFMDTSIIVLLDVPGDVNWENFWGIPKNLLIQVHFTWTPLTELDCRILTNCLNLSMKYLGYFKQLWDILLRLVLCFQTLALSFHQVFLLQFVNFINQLRVVSCEHKGVHWITRHYFLLVPTSLALLNHIKVNLKCLVHYTVASFHLAKVFEPRLSRVVIFNCLSLHRLRSLFGIGRIFKQGAKLVMILIQNGLVALNRIIRFIEPKLVLFVKLLKQFPPQQLVHRATELGIATSRSWSVYLTVICGPRCIINIIAILTLILRFHPTLWFRKKASGCIFCGCLLLLLPVYLPRPLGHLQLADIIQAFHDSWSHWQVFAFKRGTFATVPSLSLRCR